MSQIRIGVLTSGGDAQGMNAAVRAVVRTALSMGATPYAIHEGWQGAVSGGRLIHPMSWSDASSILNQGGTVIGTARCKEFREFEGLAKAAENLIKNGIDRLCVIGGDGSLSGTDEFRETWPKLLQYLQDEGRITAAEAARFPQLRIVGLVGSIDNDLVGTDMTIGADSALHRILSAIDEISSTAASHQRTFVLEVMGRHCGYLPLMAAVAGGCDYVFIPEDPPAPGWEDDMVAKLEAGRAAGRRESLVLVAEGAIDREGNPIDVHRVTEVLREKTDEDARMTILGHVQRGGTPSAYDRWMSTALGYAAVQELLGDSDPTKPVILGVRHNRVTRIPLMEAVARTRQVAKFVANHEYEKAVAARGASFATMLRINEIMSTPFEADGHMGKRVAVMHAGGLAPGMNMAARAAVRLGMGHGYTMLGIQGSFHGLEDGQVRELAWKDVEGWAFHGGAELGTRRHIPEVEELYAIGRAIENNSIDALIIIGGYNAYVGAHRMVSERPRYPAFNIPIVCIPASIDNNLPNSEISIGADTAVNNAVWALDRVKESAAASRRCFVSETMGRHCGYLAMMSGIAAGAELVYLPEDQITLEQIAADARAMADSFRSGRRLFLVVRNEEAANNYNMEFMARVFESEGKGLFDVRYQGIGHLQQGGSPTPFDRLLATRMVYAALTELESVLDAGKHDAFYIGMEGSDLNAYPIEGMFEHVDTSHRRPHRQWWRELKTLVPVVCLQDAGAQATPLTVYDSPEFPSLQEIQNTAK